MIRKTSEMNDGSESGSGGLIRGGGFDFLDTADGLFFVHDGGRRVRTDALGRAVWLSLPGERRAVLEKVRETPAVPEIMAGDFLDIMIAAGIVAEAPGSAPDFDRDVGQDAGSERIAVASKFAGGVRSAGSAGAGALGSPKPSSLNDDFGERDFPGEREADSARGGVVSAVVVSRPGRANLCACLVSLLRQTCRGLDIVVVASVRDADVAADFAVRENAAVRVVAVSERLSRAARINRGVRETQGEFLFILDAGVEADSAAVENLKMRLLGDPGAAAAAPVVRFADLRTFVKRVGKHIKGKGRPNDNFSGAVDLGVFDAAGDLPAADFDAVFIRRSAWAHVGPADGKIAGGCDDLEWSFRARLLGRRIVAAGAAVVHLGDGGQGPESEELRRIAAGRLRLVLKLFRGKTRRDYLISFVKEDIKAFLSRIARRNRPGAFAYPRAYTGLLFSLPGILWRRAGIMRRRDRGFDDAVLPGPVEGFPILAGDAGLPLIDANAYFRHYFWEFDRTRRNAGKMPAAADASRER